MREKYIVPAFYIKAFHCPHCGVLSRQYWFSSGHLNNGWVKSGDVDFCFCEHCDKKSIWFNEKMIIPSVGGVELPNPDLPSEIIDDYNEAKDIINKSPRGAAALLRLAIQKLCKHLGGDGNNINNDISELTKKGLPLKIQQSLDFVRVIGNNAVHPGQIDLKDNVELANHLFSLINIIADVMITQPKQVEELYNTLPEKQKQAINKRDNIV